MYSATGRFPNARSRVDSNYSRPILELSLRDIRVSVNIEAPTRIFHRCDWSMNWETREWTAGFIAPGICGRTDKFPRQTEARDKRGLRAVRMLDGIATKSLLVGILTKRQLASLRRISGKTVGPRANKQRLPMSKRQPDSRDRRVDDLPPRTMNPVYSRLSSHQQLAAVSRVKILIYATVRAYARRRFFLTAKESLTLSSSI